MKCQAYHQTSLDSKAAIGYNNICHEPNHTPDYRTKGDVSGCNHKGSRSDCRPTGSGKSTQIPPWCAALSDASVLVVEPRRIACRSLARWVAQQHGELLGQSVGYTVRFEDVSANGRTRIRFVTPGVALRYAAWTGIGSIRHYHSRRIPRARVEADLFLAICRKKRRDARLVIMSATLAAQQLARAIGGQVLRAEGRVYPVEVRYLGGTVVPTTHRLVERVESGIKRALKETDGNILVFLPGKGEISACQDELRRMRHAPPANGTHGATLHL